MGVNEVLDQCELDSGACRCCSGQRDPATPEEIARLRSQLDGFFAQGAYGEAYPVALHELEDAEELYGPEALEVATALNDVASVERYLGQHKAAEQRLVRAGEIIGAISGEDDPERAVVLLNLAGLHRVMRRLDDAEAEFKRALAVFSEKLGEGDIHTITVHNNLGLIYQDKGDYEQALACHTRALDLLQAPDAPEDPAAVATALMNAAICSTKLGDTAGADELFQRALDLTVQVHGRESAAYAGALNNVASFKVEQGDFARAAELLSEAEPIVGRLFGTGSPTYRLVSENLGNVRARL